MRFIIVSLFALALFSFTRAETQAIPQTITSHFSSWLKSNGYGSFNFDRNDIKAGGSYGGKQNDDEKIERQPVIFFHGNSDHAVGVQGDEFNGFTDSIIYFQSQGYKQSELYITTWGPANKALASQQYHSCEYLRYLRAFTEAVLKYTGAQKIDIIGHSMGVTLARRVIKGGSVTDKGQSCNLGSSLASKVDTFLGIAGANLGLVSCQFAFAMPTCGKDNGFYPGSAPGPIGLSKYLKDLLDSKEKEGDHVFTMLSTADDLIGYGDKVFGKYTSQFPTEDDSKIYNDLTHMGMKIKTSAQQFKTITTHKL